VTHPFHPWSGRELELVKRRSSWGADRVHVCAPGGELASLPAEWTDVVPADPFVVVAAGRAPFRTGDLLELAELAGRLRGGRAGMPRVSGRLCRECLDDYVADRGASPGHHVPLLHVLPGYG